MKIHYGYLAGLMMALLLVVGCTDGQLGNGDLTDNEDDDIVDNEDDNLVGNDNNEQVPDDQDPADQGDDDGPQLPDSGEDDISGDTDGNETNDTSSGLGDPNAGEQEGNGGTPRCTREGNVITCTPVGATNGNGNQTNSTTPMGGWTG